VIDRMVDFPESDWTKWLARCFNDWSRSDIIFNSSEDGVHGAANFEGDISGKEGIQALTMEEIFECSYRIGVA
jgi:hypothetical protein